MKDHWAFWDMTSGVPDWMGSARIERGRLILSLRDCPGVDSLRHSIVQTALDYKARGAAFIGVPPARVVFDQGRTDHVQALLADATAVMRSRGANLTLQFFASIAR